jgi:hypothetical protein
MIQSCLITNGRETARMLRMEPWGEEVMIPPGATAKLIATGEEPGELHIEDADSLLIIYGWPSSQLTLFCDEEKMWESYPPAPAVPNKMDMRSFVKFMFHSKNQEH